VELEAYEEEFGRFTSREQEMLGALVDKHDKTRDKSETRKRERETGREREREREKVSASGRRETPGNGGAAVGAVTVKPTLNPKP
jgi:hypothetical protein